MISAERFLQRPVCLIKVGFDFHILNYFLSYFSLSIHNFFIVEDNVKSFQDFFLKSRTA